MKRITKKNDVERLAMLGLEIPSNSKYDTLRFGRMTAETYDKLVEKGWIDPEDDQNGSPAFGELADFCRAYPQCTMSGYVVTPDRGDCRISCDGIEYSSRETVPTKLVIDFANAFHWADEFDVSEVDGRAWWD